MFHAGVPMQLLVAYGGDDVNGADGGVVALTGSSSSPDDELLF